MSLFWWSWLLTVVGVSGFLLAANKVWWAWYINLGCQGLWITYAIVSHQPGFIAASLIYSVVFGRNALRWTREHQRCGAEPPWRLADAGTCIIRRKDHAPDHWHADGTGFIWNRYEWRWMGPTVNLADELRDHPARTASDADFTEETP